MALKDHRQLRVVDNEEQPLAGDVVAEIDLDELQEARQDPAWLGFREQALASRAELQRNGQSV